MLHIVDCQYYSWLLQIQSNCAFKIFTLQAYLSINFNGGIKAAKSTRLPGERDNGTCPSKAGVLHQSATHEHE